MRVQERPFSKWKNKNVLSFWIFTFLLLVLFADWGINIRAPTGEVLKISKDATFQGGRILSNNKVIFLFVCFLN